MFTGKELSSKNISTRNILVFHLKSPFFHAQSEMENKVGANNFSVYYRRDLGIMVRHIEPYVIIEPLFVNTWYRWLLMLMCLSSNQIKINGFFDVFFSSFFSIRFTQYFIKFRCWVPKNCRRHRKGKVKKRTIWIEM